MRLTFKSALLLSVLCLLLLQSIQAQQKVAVAGDGIHYITDTLCNFGGLVDKFKGKTIFLNIWATWCHPCRVDLQSAAKMRAFEKFAASNEIVLLYLCADKDGKIWKSFINANKLAGYHILMNDKVNKDMHTTYAQKQYRGKDRILKMSFYLPVILSLVKMA
ncbi:TlpA family protein disulfide reductase [Mucilaginibacter antarcticus]|uniref:TlpA family protein disulfide reductase n=1 Tax=Mucilaginibacter antarcticus TaxID=1855725 RepID=A0ABW5XR15_9SPHI